MKTNVRTVVEPQYTHGGAIASHISPEQELRRSVMAYLLFEDNFYEDGKSIANRIGELIPKVSADKVASIAVEARTKMKMRHVPLLMAVHMSKLPTHRGALGKLLPQIIQRPDEISEYCALYESMGGKTLSAQSKKGLAAAFQKFDEYQLAKWRSPDSKWKLRDVLHLSHAKPKDGRKGYTKHVREAITAGAETQPQLSASELLYKKIVDDTLATPDTWEVNLSAGKDKKETFERLMAENKLGVMAFLKNLRNMQEAGIPRATVKAYSESVKAERALPFRFVSAARAVPGWEDVIEPMMLRCLERQEKLPGHTVLIVDVSGSMGGAISDNRPRKGGKSYADADRHVMSRLEVAGSLASLAREMCEEVSIFATAGSDGARKHQTAIVPNRRGFALVDAISKDAAQKLGGGGIFLIQAMDFVKDYLRKNGTVVGSFPQGLKGVDRVIVFTDEQDCDQGKDPRNADAFGKNNYIINVASHENGIAYGKFTHVTGWSEAVFEYIRAAEHAYEQSN